MVAKKAATTIDRKTKKLTFKKETLKVTLEGKWRHEMTSKRSGSKAKSGARNSKATMRNLEPKNGAKVKGGDRAKVTTANLSIMKVLDKTTP